MDQQKQGFHDDELIGAAGGTMLDQGWPAHHDLATYDNSLQQAAGECVHSALDRDLHKDERARSHHQLLTCSLKAKAGLSSRAACGPALPSSDKRLQNNMLIPYCDHFPRPMRMALVSATARPPVTTLTLMELDLNSIFHNINLRSDINFETDLHFMPVKGKRAQQKSKLAEEYWLALAGELQIHIHKRTECLPSDDPSGVSAHDNFTPRLPQMFADLRELLELLVPDRDHAPIVENLDVPFLMQQIENGVLDIVRLAKWLASLLKTHCAPMRDEWADQMSQQVEGGSLKSDVAELVNGIERLFSVLEAMKLDVANHQIRTFRFHLMEDTVAFQQRFWGKRVLDGKINLDWCRAWYDDARRRYQSSLPAGGAVSLNASYESLVYGVINSLFTASNINMLPKSFQFDLKRLEQIRSDLEDVVYLKIGHMVFDELRSHLHSGRPGPVSQDTYSQLRSRILAIVDEQSGQEDVWQISLADVALEIARAACEFSGSAEAPVPDHLIRMTYLSLREFGSTDTPESQLVWTSSLEQLTSRAIHHAQVFNSMTPLAMSESQQQWPRQRQRQDGVQKVDLLSSPNIEDIARRLAHVSVLHWKIWAHLVYLA